MPNITPIYQESVFKTFNEINYLMKRSLCQSPKHCYILTFLDIVGIVEGKGSEQFVS